MRINSKYLPVNFSFEKLSQAIEPIAQKMARRLNKTTAKIPHRQLNFLLILFCFCWTLAIVRVIRKSFDHPDGILPFASITVPGHLPFLAPDKPDAATAQAIQRIELFRRELDSIKIRDYPKYRMLLLTRPGLVDSISFIEQYYLLQKK